MRAWTNDAGVITRSVHRWGLAGVWIVGLVLAALVLRRAGAPEPIAMIGAMFAATIVSLGAAASLRESGTPQATAFWMVVIGYFGGLLAAASELAAGRSTDELVQCALYWGLVGAWVGTVLTVAIGPLVGTLFEEGAKPALQSRTRAIAITTGWIALMLGSLGAWWDDVALAATCASLLVMICALLSIAHRRVWLARVRAGSVSGWTVRPAREDETEVLLPLAPSSSGSVVLARVHVALGDPYRARDLSVAIARL